MLILSRKVGESFYIGENDEVEVILLSNGVNGQEARIGIIADRRVPIRRSELDKFSTPAGC